MKPHPPPSIQHRRPIGASGLFWSLVSPLVILIVGVLLAPDFEFFGGPALLVLFGGLITLSTIGGVIWQFKTWSFDASVNRRATQWCRKHYPSYGDTPIVD